MFRSSAPSVSTVRFSTAEFKCGSASLRDYERLGCPKTVTTDNNITQVHQIEMRMIAKAMKISEKIFVT